MEEGKIAMYGIVRKRCPLCGGRIIVSDLYQISRDHFIKANGVLSKRGKDRGPYSMEASIANCENAPDNCSALWDTDGFYIDERGRFVDLVYE